MREDDKTKKQLEHELMELRSENDALKKSISGNGSAALAAEEAGRYAESIVATVRGPLLVLDADLKIISANSNFYRTFRVAPAETIGRTIYDLGNKQWDIPKLRELLEKILPEREAFDGFEVDHYFQSIGHKIMLLNARRIMRKDIGAKLILLAIEDITERTRLESLLTQSEERYRRVFETSSDAIVLFEKSEGKITHVNQAAWKMLGYTKEEIIGNKLQDIGISLDFGAFQTTMRKLNENGIIHYDNIYIQGKSGKKINVDIYLADRAMLAQCNIRDITERKIAQAELSTSQEKFRILFEQAADIIFQLEIRPDGLPVIFDVNQATLRVLGYERDELIGQPVSVIAAPTDSPETTAEIRRNILSGSGILEVAHQCKNGAIRDFECSVTEIQIGGTSYALSVERDITERKKAEEILALNYEAQAAMDALLALSLEKRTIKEYLAFALDLILSLKWLAVEAKGAIFLADEVGEMLHLCVHQGLPKHLRAACSSVPFGHCLCGRAARERAVQFADSVGESHDTRYEGMPPHGHYCIPVLSGGHILGVITLYVKEGHARSPWEEDFLKAVAKTLSGTMERKQAEEELIKNKALLNETGKIAKVGGWEFDVDTGEQEWTEEVYRIHEVDRTYKPTVDKGIDFYAPTSRPIIEQAVHRAVEFGEPFEMELEFITAKGNHRWVHVIGKAHRENGKTQKVFGVFQDVTERKALEAQFHQAQKMESVGRLAGGVAHDFNNLLTPILGYSEILLSDSTPPDSWKESVEEIHQAGIRAKGLVRQLLTFSRKQPMEVSVLSLNEVLSAFEKLIRRTVREDVAIVMKLDKSLPRILGDAGQIEQVIMNLVVNAQDAMPSGGKLTLETGTMDLDESYTKDHQDALVGRYAMLAVSDNGVGMDAQVQARIFEPFFTTKEKGKGTGLGLATVYGIVKQHGGNVYVYSEPGKGATFKLYFPVSMGREEAVPAPAVNTRDIRGTETVMIAEDDEMVRSLAVRVLERLGYHVLQTSNGSECLKTLAGHTGPLDLLLTDVVMPEMNGKELQEKVSRRFPNIKVLYMSGYTDNVIVHHGFLDNFIQKPFSIHGLATKVRELLDKK